MPLKSAIPQKLNAALTEKIIPFGILVLLSGMFWIEERSDYQRAFYIFLALPTTIALFLNIETIRKLIKTEIFILSSAFFIYTAVSIAWTDTDSPAASLIKRPLYATMLLISTTLVIARSEKILEETVLTSIIIAAISATLSIVYYLAYDNTDRLTGYRALYNPLLTSHVYGMFTAMAIALLFTLRDKKIIAISIMLPPLLLLLLLTGSRTPLLALTLTLAWLISLYRNKTAMTILFVSAASAALLITLYPESIMSRGFSYRPEIWHQAWLQIIERPWFGHGYDHKMIFWVEGIDYAFSDPHNIELAVLFSGGIVGLTIWLTLYAYALLFAWKNHENTLIVMASAALVFGFGAGLTEGKDFISRPKEHWFLIWIPFSLLAASWFLKREKQHA